MERNEIIIELFFTQKMKQKEIAEKLNISKYIVSRTLIKDSRYKEEKERRKEISKQKHNERKVESVIKKRMKTRIDYETLKQQHIQASLELSSGNRVIGNREFRNFNSSIYKYDKKTKSYKVKPNINITNDVPKKIKW